MGSAELQCRVALSKALSRPKAGIPSHSAGRSYPTHSSTASTEIVALGILLKRRFVQAVALMVGLSNSIRGVVQNS